METRQDYLNRRAREEAAAADRASTDKARDLHLELAARYRDSAEDEGDVAVDMETVSSTLPKEFRTIE